MENPRGTKPDRKTIEKNRRMHMKSLCSKLESLLPMSTPRKEGTAVPLQDRIDEAITYIKSLQENIERMHGRKRQLMMRISGVKRGPGFGWSSSSSPKFEVHDLGAGGAKVVVKSSSDDRVVFHNVVEALEEEGMQIVSANYAVAGDEALHIIHAHTSVSGVRRLEAHELMEILVNKTTHTSVWKGFPPSI